MGIVVGKRSLTNRDIVERFPKLPDDQLMLLTLELDAKTTNLLNSIRLQSFDRAKTAPITHFEIALFRDLPAKNLDVYMDVFARISSTRSVFEMGSAQPMRTWDTPYQGVALKFQTSTLCAHCTWRS